MANPSSIVENDEVSLELAATLVDEEHSNEFEAILGDSLQEIPGKKEFVCSECGKIEYKTKRDESATFLTRTLLRKICCREMI